jgi:hypothetical protein
VRHEHFCAYRTLLARRKNREKTSRMTSFPPVRWRRPRRWSSRGERTSWCFDGVKLTVPASLAGQRSGLVVEAAVAGGERVSGCVMARVVTYWEARAATGSVVDGEFLRGLRHVHRVELIHAVFF